MRFRRLLLKGYIVLSLLLGLMAGAATAYMALDHNPQGAYCAYVPKGESGNYVSQGDECNIVFGNLAPLVVFNAILVAVVFLLPVAFYLGVAALLAWLRRHLAGRAADESDVPTGLSGR
jgi:hypothetical protein